VRAGRRRCGSMKNRQLAAMILCGGLGLVVSACARRFVRERWHVGDAVDGPRRVDGDEAQGHVGSHVVHARSSTARCRLRCTRVTRWPPTPDRTRPRWAAAQRRRKAAFNQRFATETSTRWSRPSSSTSTCQSDLKDDGSTSAPHTQGEAAAEDHRSELSILHRPAPPRPASHADQAPSRHKCRHGKSLPFRGYAGCKRGLQ